MPGPLYGGAQSALVLGANTALTTGLYLGPVGNVAAQPLVVLIVDVLDVLHAEGAHPTARRVTSPGPPTGSGSASRARASGLKAAGTGAGAGTSAGSGAALTLARRSGAGLSCRGRS